MRSSRLAGHLVVAALVTVAAACSSSGAGPAPGTKALTSTAPSSTAPPSTAPPSTAPSSTAPPTPAPSSPAPAFPAPAGTNSRNVRFVVDGTTTFGTLEIPAHRAGQHLAAALLIPGSGPTDRNGNDTGLGVTADTLELIANLLARQGVMTLRYDKYFTGATGGGRYALDPAAITISSFFDQASAAYEFLAGQPDADAARLLVVGHIEGGMVALHLAVTEHDPPAGLALLEPQDERFLTLIELQTDEAIDSLEAAGTLTAEQAQANRTIVAQAVATFRRGGTVSGAGTAPQVEQILAPFLFTPDNVRYTRTDDAVDPVQLAASVPGGVRVLVTEGTRDSNVPPSTVGPLVRALARARTTGPGLTVVQGMDHFMHLASQPDTEAVLAPAVVSALHGWARPFSS